MKYRIRTNFLIKEPIMNVTSVQSPAITAVVGKVNSPTTTSTQATPAAIEDIYTSKIASIAAKYDPTNIPLSQIADLGKELYSKGLIPSDANSILMGLSQRQELAMSQGLSIGGLNVSNDGKVNLLAFYDSHRTSQPNANASKLAEDTYKALDAVALQAASFGTFPDAAPTTNDTQDPLNLNSAITAYKSSIGQATHDNQKIYTVLQAMVESRNNTSAA
jgi:hypothetical protein